MLHGGCACALCSQSFQHTSSSKLNIFMHWNRIWKNRSIILWRRRNEENVKFATYTWRFKWFLKPSQFITAAHTKCAHRSVWVPFTFAVVFEWVLSDLGKHIFRILLNSRFIYFRCLFFALNKNKSILQWFHVAYLWRP